MRICAIMPTLGHRPLTEKLNISRIPSYIDLIKVDYPSSGNVDICKRFNYGITKAKLQCYEYAFFIEDDDYYPREYYEKYLDVIIFNKATLYGIDETIYYNLKLDRYVHMKHPQRSSMFCSAVNLNKIDFDVLLNAKEPYADLYLFDKIKDKHLVSFDELGCKPIGIKHGIGKCGGNGHEDRLYNNSITGGNFLINNTDKKAYEIYKRIKEQI